MTGDGAVLGKFDFFGGGTKPHKNFSSFLRLFFNILVSVNFFLFEGGATLKRICEIVFCFLKGERRRGPWKILFFGGFGGWDKTAENIFELSQAIF